MYYMIYAAILQHPAKTTFAASVCSKEQWH